MLQRDGGQVAEDLLGGGFDGRFAAGLAVSHSGSTMIVPVTHTQPAAIGVGSLPLISGPASPRQHTAPFANSHGRRTFQLGTMLPVGGYNVTR